MTGERNNASLAWKQVYKNRILGIHKSFGINTAFAIYDIYQNGTPEIMHGSVTKGFYVETYKNDGLHELGFIQGIYMYVPKEQDSNVIIIESIKQEVSYNDTSVRVYECIGRINRPGLYRFVF